MIEGLGIANSEDVDTELPQNTSCQLKASDPKFSGETGKKMRLKCPKNCGKADSGGNIFGSNVYTDDSSICASAIHAGFSSNDKGGDFVM
jgi:hypothetical protein